MKRVLFTLLAVAVVVGCAKEDNYSAESLSDNVVQFSSTAISTRIDTSTNEWIAGDSIGIASSGFVSSGFSSEFKNVKYKAASAGEYTNFTVADGEVQIIYPNVSQSSSVTFYAYYPYGSLNSDEESVTVDVSTQNSEEGLAAIDFMTASDTVEYSDNNYTGVDFAFGHKLSQVVMYISCNDDLESLNGLTATISGIETKGSYYVCDATNLGALYSPLSDKGSVELIVPSTDSSTKTATITAILHPGIYTTPTLTFEANSKKYSVTFATTLEKGKSHTFSISLGYDIVGFKSGSTIDDWVSATATVTPLYPEEKGSYTIAEIGTMVTADSYPSQSTWIITDETIDSNGFASVNAALDLAYTANDSSCISLEFPYLTSSVASSAFSGCYALGSVSMPLVTTVSESAWSGCTALEEVCLPSLTEIKANAFDSCTSLETIYFATNAGTEMTAIGADLFKDATDNLAANCTLYIGSTAAAASVSLVADNKFSSNEYIFKEIKVGDIE